MPGFISELLAHDEHRHFLTLSASFVALQSKLAIIAVWAFSINVPLHWNDLLDNSVSYSFFDFKLCSVHIIFYAVFCVDVFCIFCCVFLLHILLFIYICIVPFNVILLHFWGCSLMIMLSKQLLGLWPVGDKLLLISCWLNHCMK